MSYGSNLAGTTIKKKNSGYKNKSIYYVKKKKRKSTQNLLAVSP